MSVYQLSSVAIQADGKIVCAGSVTEGEQTAFLVVRYDGTTGALDNTFDGDGIVTTAIGTYSSGKALAIQADGKIVVAGSAMVGGTCVYAVARYNDSDGSLDGSFGTGGIVTTPVPSGCSANAIAIQSDGKIVVVGTAVIGGTPNIVTIRYDDLDGSLDNSFNGTGIRTDTFNGRTHGYAVAIQPDASIVVGGICSDDFVVARYTPLGALDTSFNTVGWRTTDVGANDAVHALLIQADNMIVAVGSSGGRFALVRYTSLGALDSGFGSGGIVLTSLCGTQGGLSAILESNQQIVISGFCSSNAITVRYLTNGDIDTSYAVNGSRELTQGNEAQSLALVLQMDGSVVAAGNTDNSVLVFRVDPFGAVDRSFGSNGVVYTPMGIIISSPSGQSSIVSKTANNVVNTSSNVYASLISLYLQPGTYSATFDSTVSNTSGTISDAVKVRISIGGVEQDSSERQIANLGNVTLYTSATVTVSSPTTVDVEWAIVGSGYTYSTLSNRSFRALRVL